MKKAIIIGASSGIGRDLAIELSKRGYELGISSRRLEMLQEVASACTNKVHIKPMDMEKQEDARAKLGELIAEMGGVDIIIYNAGIGESSGKWEKEKQMHEINVVGFAAIANYAFKYFRESGRPGQIVGVSSVAGTRGMRHAIGYGATKAFMWNYMQGQRHKAVAEKLDISITDIRPGFIDTPMTKGQKGMFWLVDSVTAGRLIADAIEAKKKTAFIPAKWAFASFIMRILPDFIWHKS
jgi:short-subunit dehydrogenase